MTWAMTRAWHGLTSGGNGRESLVQDDRRLAFGNVDLLPGSDIVVKHPAVSIEFVLQAKLIRVPVQPSPSLPDGGPKLGLPVPAGRRESGLCRPRTPAGSTKSVGR